MSGLRHDKEILDPHATDPSTIEPRLHRHHLTWLQLRIDTCTQPRRLVNDETDAMPSGMCEEGFMPTTCEFVATPRIDGTTLDVRANHFDCGLLNLANRLIHLNEAGGALSHQKRSRHVRVIALHECTNVDDESVPVHDSPIGRTMMRKRRIRTARHDCVVTRPIGACLAHQILEFVPDVALRHFATFQQGFEILNLLAGEFGFRPLPREELEFARDLSTSGLMKHLGISRMKLHKISKRGTEEIAKRIDSVQIFDGVPEMVRHLHAAGFRLGILTSNSEANVRAFLKNHNLKFFDFIESSSKLLGKGSVLRRLMKERGLKPKEVLLIGDELRDIEAAQETGVHMAAVTWGYNSRSALEAAEPDYLFETPAQVVEFLDGWRPENPAE